MKRVRIVSLLMAFLLIFSTFAGCGMNSSPEDSKYKIYCLNMDMTGIVAEGYEPDDKGISGNELADILLERLHGEPDTATLRQAIPNDFECSYNISGYMMNVDLTGNFYNMSMVEKKLIVAAIVRTMVQVPEVSYVNMYVNSEPMVDSEGRVIRSLNADSFVENTGKQINDKQSTDITLYFADEIDPTRLKKETVHVTFNNKSIDKIIMEKLIQGPSENAGMKATVPSGTKIINSSILDGVCYVNLSESFINNQDNTITEEVVLYSIVNSLCSIPDVNKVQITVNGDTSGKVRYNYELANLYEMDESLLSTGDEPVIETETEPETEAVLSTEEAGANQ